VTLRKAFAVAATVVILGAQAWVIFPPGWGRPHYWPFIDYPMYSGSFHQGDSLVRQELRATPCGAPGAAVPLHIDSLPLEPWQYWPMLGRLAASPDPAPLLDTLGRFSRFALHRNPCALELWRQVLVIGPHGVRLEDTVWRRFRAWPLRPDSGSGGGGGGGVSPPGSRH
jgi:hypothetical protein